MLRLGNTWWLYIIGIINLPMYSMELKHLVCKNLKMIIGELGPVENELIFSLIYILSGFWGADLYENKIGILLGLNESSLMYDY